MPFGRGIFFVFASREKEYGKVAEWKPQARRAQIKM